MARRGREWPGQSQWYCCPSCNRLWTHRGKDVVALDSKFALGLANPSEGAPGQRCKVCRGEQALSFAEVWDVGKPAPSSGGSTFTSHQSRFERAVAVGKSHATRQTGGRGKSASQRPPVA